MVTAAKQYGKPVINIAGALGANAHVVHDHGIDAIFGVQSNTCTIKKAVHRYG